MAEAGILEERTRVELLDGLLVEMSPNGMRHRATQARILEYLFRALAGRASVVGPFSMPLGEYDEPEPDIGIFAFEPTNYFSRRARLDETFAVIEVSETSLQTDTGLKRDLYARFGVQEYLIADIPNRMVRRYTNSDGARYADVDHLSYGETFRLIAIPEIELDVDPFLPPKG